VRLAMKVVMQNDGKLTDLQRSVPIFVFVKLYDGYSRKTDWS